MSPAQHRYYEEGMKKIGLMYRTEVLDLAAAFDRAAPCVLEIGFGMGETTARIAAAHPEMNFLCIEVHTPGVGALCKLVDELSLTNIRIIQHDAVEVVRDMIAAEALAGVHIYFPDPWHKAKHNKRRIVQSPLVKLLAQRLAPEGYLHCATDWEDYAHQMLEVLSAEPLLVNTAEGFAPQPAWRPQTKFETRGLKLGHGVWDVLFRRKV